uniref:Galectin n=1 Tax=Oryzias latipes TaxID=8090 RepID=A0A3B3HC31_ORYLA
YFGFEVKPFSLLLCIVQRIFVFFTLRHLLYSKDRQQRESGRKNIALHLNPRFDVWGDKDTIVLNSVENSKWKDEVQPGGFCFFRGESFKIIIKFKCKGFSITLPNGSRITVPNCIYSFYFQKMVSDLNVLYLNSQLILF